MNKILREFMNENGMNQKQVAAAFNVSIPTISQYLNDKYMGKNDELDEKVKDLIARFKEKKIAANYNDEFVRTFSAMQMIEVMRDAHVEGDVSVIYGAAGLGKTQAVKAYERENPSAIVIETCPSYTPKVLLQKIAEKMNLNTNGRVDAIFDAITAKLVGSERVLLIDEAELLSTRSLEFIRRIHDMTKVGVVLIGMPRLLINLKGANNELAQLYGRVWRACDLGNALPEDDLTMLVESGLGSDEFAPLFIKYSKGNARRLSKLIRGVVRLSKLNERPIDEKLIQAYTKMLIN
ncbi:transcriptional regulator [Mergibacter septicus]|uniref:AAA family ATPase n=1 Tax=Mergibacter septicus TaxID=221402 RepID=UPI001178DBCF|nr:AAA family ATPase [Mergibacter septicus]AWX14242.1 transcriptional regulator [Mergibacter septicus]